MSVTKILTVGAAAMLLASGGAAFAKSKTASVKAQSPESLACSKEADAKGLHGKARKEFRAKCKKDAEAKKTDVSKPADSKPAPGKKS